MDSWDERRRQDFKNSVESAINFPFYIFPILLFIFGVCVMILIRYCQTHPDARNNFNAMCCSLSSTPIPRHPPPMVELSPHHPQVTPDSNFFNSPSPQTHQYQPATAPLQLPNGHSQLAPDSNSAGSSSPRLPHQPATAPVPGWCLPGVEIGPGTGTFMNYGAAAGDSSNAGGANDKPPMYADAVMGNFDLVAAKQPDVKATVPETPPPEYSHSRAVFYSTSDEKK